MPEPRKPLTFYRLWCGRKRYSGWLPSLKQTVALAYRLGLAYRNLNGDGGGSLGPLSWIEVGTRKYARSRIIPETPLRDPPWS